MQGPDGYIQVDEGKLHYHKWGSGPRLLIAFHGYGSNAGSFLPLARAIGEIYTVISVDLPHHGNSSWEEKKFLRKKDLVRLTRQLMKKFNVQEVSLAGYSMGARSCLSIIELIPEKIQRVLLAAPDGLTYNAFYRFVTGTAIGRRMFAGCMVAPGPYIGFIDRLRRVRVVKPALQKFVVQYLQSQGNRDLLNKVWPSMRFILPAARQVIKTIRKYEMPVYIFMGAQDNIIPLKNARRISKISSVQLQVLQKGHRVLDNETIPLMAACLLK